MRVNEAVVATILCFGLAAVAIGLEGAVVREHGGWLLAAAGVVGAAWCVRAGIEASGRATRLAGGLLAVVIAWQFAPVPHALRRIVAPGQAAWLDRVGDGSGDLDAWLAALSTYDVDAALGMAGPWAF